MIPHLPRPARSYSRAVARTTRRLKTGAEEIDQVKVKRPKPPSNAFNALQNPTRRPAFAGAAPDSD